MSDPTTKAVQACATWLSTCLNLGWRKTDLDFLEGLWWKHHDAHGNLIQRQSAQAGPGVAQEDNTTEEAAPRVLGVPAVEQRDLARSGLELARYALSIDGIEFGRFVLLAQVDAYFADLRSRVRIERIDEQADEGAGPQ